MQVYYGWFGVIVLCTLVIIVWFVSYYFVGELFCFPVCLYLGLVYVACCCVMFVGFCCLLCALWFVSDYCYAVMVQLLSVFCFI